MIPLLDLSFNYALTPMGADIAAAVGRVRCSGRYVLGPEVDVFETEWAKYCGMTYCVGTGNALDALRIALMAWGVGPGDEVIVPSNTYIATWLAVTLVGATIVPVEPDPATFNLDPLKIAAAMSVHTKVIIPVHLYGRAADVTAIRALVGTGVKILVDAAQGHGLTTTWCEDAAAYSFYPSKNLGALGDGGALVTNSPDLASAARRLRNYGGVGRLDHQVIGINSRLDELQAAVLRAKLPYLEERNHRRTLRALRYTAELTSSLLVTPSHQGETVWHQYVVRVKAGLRDALVAHAAELGLELHVHYPVPPYRERAYQGRIHYNPKPGSTIADQLASEVVSLPIGYAVDQDEVIRIVRLALLRACEEQLGKAAA